MDKSGPSKRSKVEFDPIVRTESGKEIPEEKISEFANTTRFDIKNQYGKNTMYFNPDLGNTQVKWPGANKDYNWPTREESYYQTDEERRKSRKEMSDEVNVLTGKWDIKNVDENGNATLCNIVTGVCIVVALTAAAASAFSGGKTRSKKRKGKKTRRKQRNKK